MTAIITYDFDTIVDRRNSDSHKWNEYKEDVLPMWISDMDFVSPQPVLDALHKRVQHGVFGYPLHPPKDLCALIIEIMATKYNWEITEEDFVFLPGTHDSFKLACRMVGVPGDGVLMHTPLYPPLLHAPSEVGRVLQTDELIRDDKGHYSVDYDSFEGAITAITRLYILCNPHNPVGRVYTRSELEKIAEICLRHNLVICSDDVHCDLVYPGHAYTPIASIDPEIADRTITLIAPSKTYNLAGLKLSMAIIQNRELRAKIRGQLDNYPSSIFGIVAAIAAYRDGGEWYQQMMAYLTSNRDFLVSYVNDCLPGVRMTPPESTYLAWLDCRQPAFSTNPFEFFLETANVALGNGENFGNGGNGFVRLNFACSRSLLAEALEKMAAALQRA